MSNYKTLQSDIDVKDVLHVTLNRPEKRNALSAQLIVDLSALADHLIAAPPRVVVLRGAGPVFCAGGELGWMMDQMQADRATRIREARALAMMLKARNELPVPVVARIHGGAFGGGVGLACIADVAVAADDTRFGLTETRLGVIPATIAPYVIARLGEGPARRVFMSSRRFGAAEAQALGLIAKAVSPDDLDAAVEDEVAPYLSVAPGAVASAKALARSLGPRIDDAVIDDTIARLADTWESPEARQGVAAFLEKRPFPWDPTTA